MIVQEVTAMEFLEKTLGSKEAAERVINAAVDKMSKQIEEEMYQEGTKDLRAT